MNRSVALFTLGILLCAVFPAGADDVAVATSGKSANTPEQTVKTVLEGLAENRPEVIWQAMPAGYRADVEELIHGAAAKMDPELWNRIFAVLGKASRVLSEKSAFILDHPALAAKMQDRATAEKSWNAVVELIDIVLKSELSDLEKLQALDVDKFLSGTGSAVFKQFSVVSAMGGNDVYGQSLTKLRETKVVPVASDGSTATVRIETPGKDPVERQLQRVEDKWIPRNIAAEWPEKMAAAKARLVDYSPEEMLEAKQSILMQLNMVEAMLDVLLQAETAEQFHAALQPVMGMVLGAAMAQANAGQGPAGVAPESQKPADPPQQSAGAGASM
jgi:hypothetical protein